MSEHAYIAMKSGKSNLFPAFAKGKTVIIGLMGASFPIQSVPERCLYGVVTEWESIDKDYILQLEEDGFDTIIFYSYDILHEVKGHIKRIEKLLLMHFRGIRRSVFMFKGL